MACQARIDAPGALHHIIVRGIERKKIFRDDKDRNDFLDRIGAFSKEIGGEGVGSERHGPCSKAWYDPACCEHIRKKRREDRSGNGSPIG